MGQQLAETSIPDWRVVLDARDKGATVVAIDPRFTSTSAGSDMWLPIRPGTDVALIDGIINYVIQTKAYDATYLKKYTVAPFLVDPKTGKWLRSNAVSACRARTTRGRRCRREAQACIDAKVRS